MTKLEAIWGLTLFFALALGITVLLPRVSPETYDPRSEYCEMVQLYFDSQGEFGWPPFNGECQ